MQEQVYLTRWETNRVNPSTPLTLTHAWKSTAAQLPVWQARDLLDPSDPQALLEIHTASGQAGSRDDPITRVQAAVYMQRRVYGHLSRVYLHLMHQLACEQGVPFNPLSSIADTQLPEELLPIATKIRAQALAGHIELRSDEERLLRQRYIHQSANWNAAIGEGLGVVNKVFSTCHKKAGDRFTISRHLFWCDHALILLPLMQLSYAWHSFFLRHLVTMMAGIVSRLTKCQE